MGIICLPQFLLPEGMVFYNIALITFIPIGIAPDNLIGIIESDAELL